jgi:glycosyltransferase involved in cell wall biosynthesis
MIKVLFTIPNFDTAGSGKALLNLAMGLDKSKFEAHIACLHNRGEFFVVVKESGIPVHIFDYLSPARPIAKLLIKSWEISRILKRIKPDIIHSFHYSADYTEALAAKMAGIPWVFTKKNMSWGGASARAWKLRSYLAKGIIVQNADMMNLFYPKKNTVKLISRGINIENFAPKTPDNLIRQKMQTALDDRLIICVANLVPVKGIEILLRAFKVLYLSYTNWKLWIIGDDSSEYGKNLKRWVLENDLQTKVIFSGKQSDIAAYLNHSEIFVLPTLGKGEGSPVAMLEAMANEKIVIGSAVPGIKDQLKEFPHHLFNPGNWEDLKTKLEGFMVLPSSENQRLGIQFSELAKRHFSIENEISQHEQFYQTILSA